MTDTQTQPLHARSLGAVDTPDELALRAARQLGDRVRGRLRVLDPAAGAGALLIAIWRTWKDSGRLTPGDLHGIELNPARAAEARAQLVATCGSDVGTVIADNLRCADALAAKTVWPAGTHVIANPPWVSYSGRGGAALDSERRADLHKRFESFASWPSLHGAFLERIAQHLGAHAKSGSVLAPASIAELAGYAPARRATTRWATLDRAPLELGAHAFPHVVEPAMLLELSGRRMLEGTGSEAPWPLERRSADPLLDALEHSPRLPPECFADMGVHTGNSARALVVPYDETLDPQDLPGLREGRDLQAFTLAEPRLGLRTQLERSATQRFRIGVLERFERIPIVIRQTADRPIAALHTTPTYFRNSLLACTPPHDLAPELVVAVLNSDLLARYHRARFIDARQKSFPQVKMRHLRALPFPFTKRAPNPRLHDAIAGARGSELERLLSEAFALKNP